MTDCPRCRATPIPLHTCPDKRLFGYPVRLLVELPDGEHDVTHCIEILTDTRARVEINIDQLLEEIAIEKRTRERVRAR